MGADRTVLDWARVVSYFQALEHHRPASASRQLGKTTEGRPLIAVTIAAPATLRNLDRYAWIQRSLRTPASRPRANRSNLIAEGKAVCSSLCLDSQRAERRIHHHAHRVRLPSALPRNTPRFRATPRQHHLPCSRPLSSGWPDWRQAGTGQTLGTPFEGHGGAARLSHKYGGHDLNRDWYFFTQAETRLTSPNSTTSGILKSSSICTSRAPSPRASFVPPWMDPIDPTSIPLLAQECNLIGTGIAVDLTAAGKTGVVMNALYDFWGTGPPLPGLSRRFAASSRNPPARRLATALTVRPDEIETSRHGFCRRQRSWNYLQPWLGGAVEAARHRRRSIDRHGVRALPGGHPPRGPAPQLCHRLERLVARVYFDLAELSVSISLAASGGSRLSGAVITKARERNASGGPEAVR